MICDWWKGDSNGKVKVRVSIIEFVVIGLLSVWLLRVRFVVVVIVLFSVFFNDFERDCLFFFFIFINILVRMSKCCYFLDLLL